MQLRRFTLRQANSLLPWLERTFERLNRSMGRLEEFRERLADIRREQQRLNGSFDRYSEINDMQAELDQMNIDLQEIVDDIIAEGIIIRDIPSGLVDFPHLLDGRVVYLCWIRGEESIGFWHETDRGFDNRQPL